jgi:predicted MFS family arabinose efflux permease
LFGLIVILGELSNGATFWISTYDQLFACRVLTGIAIGGAAPVIFSLLADLFPGDSRISMSTLVGIAMSAGIASGQLIAGLMGPALGWRSPFLVVAIPCLLCGLLVTFTCEEPARGGQEEEVLIMRRAREKFLLTQSGTIAVVEPVPGQGYAEHEGAGPRLLSRDPAARAPWYGTVDSLTVPVAPQTLDPTLSAAARTLTSASASQSSEDSAEVVNPMARLAPLHLPGAQPVSTASPAASPRRLMQPLHRRLKWISSHMRPRRQDTAAESKTAENTENAENSENAEDEESPPSVRPTLTLTLTPDPLPSYDEKISLDKVKQLFSTPSVVIIMLQGLPGCLPWGLVYVFLNDYFSSDRGLTVAWATIAVVLFSVGGFLGQAGGGYLGQHLYNRDKRLQCLLMGISTLLAVPPMLYLLNAEIRHTKTGPPPALFYMMAFVAGAVVSVNGPNVRSVLQNVTSPECRGTAFAVFTLADDLGKGFGPFLVVLMIQSRGGRRKEAFNIVVLFWIFCGMLLLLLVFTVLKDEVRRVLY